MYTIYVCQMASSNRRWRSRPQIKGYQDTLYAKKNNQLYHERHIEGTVDFIFGNTTTVF
jgi:pectin methylesterase-like acyl-CoA thioesterase